MKLTLIEGQTKAYIYVPEYEYIDQTNMCSCATSSNVHLELSCCLYRQLRHWIHIDKSHTFIILSHNQSSNLQKQV